MEKKFSLPPAPAQPAVLPFGRDRPWLAPLAGYSDLPFRLLCREQGADVCETEMISAKGLLYKSPGTAQLLQNTQADVPLVVQLFGSEPGIMGDALFALRQAGYIFFDCNMGCSVNKVMRQGAGAALLAEPAKATAVAKAMLANACRLCDAPPARVGFKLRLGMDAERTIIPDLALRLEDAGAAWICLHPRSARQLFAGEADWKALADLSCRLSIPLLASGDLHCAQKGLECIDETGATGVMYARGAMNNPAIFREHKMLCSGVRPAEENGENSRMLIARHVALARAYLPERVAFYKMRSVVGRYARNWKNARLFRTRLCQCQGWPEFYSLLSEWSD